MKPIARNTDPITSHIAADKFTRSGKRQTHMEIIYNAIKEHPDSTAGELGEITGLGQFRVSRRLSEITGIKPCKERLCGVNGSLMRTWRIR